MSLWGREATRPQDLWVFGFLLVLKDWVGDLGECIGFTSFQGFL